MSSSLLDACLHWPPIQSSGSSNQHNIKPSDQGAVNADPNDVGFGQTILITDEIAAPGSFLLYHFLSRFLRPSLNHHEKNYTSTSEIKKWKSVFVGHADSYKNYAQSAKKMGINFTTATQKGRFDFVDANGLISSKLAPSGFPTRPCYQPSEWVTSLIDTVNIRSGASENCRPCIVIDDITYLLFLGASLSDIMSYIHAIKAMVESRSGIFIILAHHDTGIKPLISQQIPLPTGSSSDELLNIILVNQLRQTSHIILQVEPLGATHGVDGQITLIRGPRLHESYGYILASKQYGYGIISEHSARLFRSACEIKPNVIHYKLLDNSVQMAFRGFSQGII